MTKVKLCGLTREDDILAVNRLLPDYIGFVFFEKSKRYIGPEAAKNLKALLDKRIKAVGVFVNADIELVSRLLSEGVIDIAQLHGNEDEEYILKLKAQAGKPVIKAFKVDQDTDLQKIESCPADMVLVDSGAGSGEAFDWSSVKGIKRDFFLAGGLTPENAAEAIKQLNPYALDVSSGIETDGLKDEQKMRAFVESARNYN